MPSIALMRSTKPRIGCLLVGSMSSMRQSHTAMCGFDLAARRSQRQLDHLFRAVGEIDVRHLLEGDEYVAVPRTPLAEMAVRVELGGDHCASARRWRERAREDRLRNRHSRARPSRRASPRRTMSTGKRGAELTEDLIAEPFIGRLADDAGRLGPGRGALDQREALLVRAAAGHDHRGAAQRRRLGMRGRAARRSFP